MSSNFRSWGTIPHPPQETLRPFWVSELADLFANQAQSLAVGNGRSYGDSCLLQDHPVIQTTQLNRIIRFDRQTGVIQVEPGVKLCDLLTVVVPAGWFLPVTPGTSLATVGGAVANDVHGKNHHTDGSLGCHVLSLDLLTSDRALRTCTQTVHTDLFNATIGGLGLTGIITAVELQLIPINTSWLDVRYQTFPNLEEFARLSTEARDDYRYTVAWMDCATPGSAGRGVLISANHSEQGDLTVGTAAAKFSVPMNCPKYTLNKYSIRAFNALYYQLQKRKEDGVRHEHYQPYFYPLDAIGHWNRVYGKKGFHQYQFLVPLDAMPVMSDILNTITNSGMGSFLAVLKEFGDIASPGLLSFPRPGYCLALDFSERGEKTAALISELDARVREAGGAAYPAKDKLMSADSFQQYYPQWTAFRQHIDPVCSSDFWQRVSNTSVSTHQTQQPDKL